MQSVPGKEGSIPKFGTRRDGIDYIHRPGAYAVIENSHKQVAIIATGAGYFLPGGGVDPGEAVIEALKREILEETGYQACVSVKIGEALEYIQANSDGKYYEIHSVFYKAQLAAKTGEGMEKDHQLVWLEQENAIKLLVRQSQAWAILKMAKG